MISLDIPAACCGDVTAILFSGTLAPSFLASPDNNSIDVIVASHWVDPAKIPVLSEKDTQCIEGKIKGGKVT